MRSLFFATIVIAGCGSSDAGSTSGGAVTPADIESSCSQACAARKKCISTTDETTCVNACKNQYASFSGKVRRDYVDLQNNCVATASCDKLDDCDDTAKASIAPTSAAHVFCDELIKKNTDCRVMNNDKSRCLNDFKVFVDSALDSARTCLTKACLEYGACVAASLGVRL